MKFSFIKRIVPFVLLFAVSLIFTNCATEESSTLDATENSKLLKSRFVNLDEIKQIPGVVEKLNTLAPANANMRIIASSTYKFTIDTERVLMIEKDDYQSFTFPIVRDSANGYLENLFLHPHNGRFLAFIIRHELTPGKLTALENGTSTAQMFSKFDVMPLDDPGFDSDIGIDITVDGGGYTPSYWYEDGECWTNGVYNDPETGEIMYGVLLCPGCPCENGSNNSTSTPGFSMSQYLAIWDIGGGGGGGVNTGGSWGGGGGGGNGGYNPFNPPASVDPNGNIVTHPSTLGFYNGNPIIGVVAPTYNALTSFKDNLNAEQAAFWGDSTNQTTIKQITDYLQDNLYSRYSRLIAKNWIDLAILLKDNPGTLLRLSNDDIQEWLNLIQFAPPQSVVNKINSLDQQNFGDYNIQYIQGARGAICNMDYFPVKISVFPTNPQTGQPFTPFQFLNYVRTNLNNFVDTTISSFFPSTITGYNEAQIWNSSNPVNAIIHINISGAAGDGSVICSKSTGTTWMFTTIEVPWKSTDEFDGIHPVSGNREFGLMANSDGTYTFYTRGADRMTDSLESLMAENNIVQDVFEKPDLLWNSLRSNIYYYVENNNGSADPISTTPSIIHRPAWNEVKRVLIGEIPASSLLND
ncbi:hypothetical protein AM493_12225 [Flavobacterium akiainvivens]|uniref:Uncharacterized protein n=1 Tax=Flavobacterium akiainvivens TaxID=1202724 RepID=A0A0M8MI50_9FLAO|nr:hypothetical protein [Flavobacterium akiainvivens]KOS06711.1 hypothetical protein AM493_12225 [Flavobacterium akiainvivens]SFQ71176.1 hypothetical protein SAMN05444144_11687 [Flavobacterium akiainvivens]